MACLWLGGFAHAVESGRLDGNFIPELVPRVGDLGGLAKAPEGRYFTWGNFHRAGSLRRINLARMNADGAVDGTFDAGLSTVSSIKSVAVQADGKALVLGELYLADGTVLPPLVRFHNNGSLDEAFQLPDNIGIIESILVTPSQKILLTGLLFPSGNRATSVLSRFNPDGSRDTTFSNGGIYRQIHQLHPMSGDRLLVSGYERYNGYFSREATVILNADGRKDESFVPAAGLIYNRPMAVINDQIYQANPSGSQILRYLSNGSLDTSYTCSLSRERPIGGLYVLDSGRLLVTGSSEVIIVSGSTPLTGYFVSYDYYSKPNFIEQADGGLVARTLTYFGALKNTALTRLKPDGHKAAFGDTFQVFSGPSKLVPAKDGKTYVETISTRTQSLNGYALLRIRNNGQIDPGFNYTVRDPGYSPSPVLLDNGDLILRDAAITAPTLGFPSSSTLFRIAPSGTMVRELKESSPPVYTYVNNWTAFPDGKVVVGRILSYVDPEYRPLLGVFTASFAPQAGFTAADEPYYVLQTIVSPKGNIFLELLEPNFSYFNQRPLIRLLPNGQKDPGFTPPIPQKTELQLGMVDALDRVYKIRPLAIESDTIVGSYNELPVRPDEPAIQRLKADGTVDESFNAAIGRISCVNQVRIQKYGRILISGKLFNAEGTKISTLARLLPDGALDETFIPPTGEVASINALAVEADGNVLVGGNFDRIGNAERPGLARLKSMELPQVKNLTFTGSGISLQLDGNPGHTWWIQSSPDLMTWTTISTVTTGSDTDTIELPAPGSGNKFYRAVQAP